ncbi:hypothetical protein D3C77_337910 [compost metagenome]
MLTREAERVLCALGGGGGSIDRADDLNAVAAGQGTEPTYIGDLDRGVTARIDRPIQDHPIAHAGTACHASAQCQYTVVTDIGSGDRQRATATAADQADSAAITQPGDLLIEAACIEYCARGNRMHRGGTEGIWPRSEQGPCCQLGRAGVGIGPSQ